MSGKRGKKNPNTYDISTELNSLTCEDKAKQTFEGTSIKQSTCDIRNELYGITCAEKRDSSTKKKSPDKETPTFERISSGVKDSPKQLSEPPKPSSSSPVAEGRDSAKANVFDENSNSNLLDNPKPTCEKNRDSSTNRKGRSQKKETPTERASSDVKEKRGSSIPVAGVMKPLADKVINFDEKNLNSLLISVVHLAVLVYVIFFIAFFNGDTPSTPPPFRFQYTPQLDTCVSSLSRLFPSQEPTLWKQILNAIKYNLESSKTVLCQTIITHESNANALKCMLNKVSNCLKTDPSIFPENSISNTPDQLIDQIRSRLNHVSSDFVIFQNTSYFPHPLPILFHSICDPDYTQYPQSHFYFTLLTDEVNTVELSKVELAKVVEKALLEAWSNPQYKEEEAIASIVRITPVVYYMRQEEVIYPC